MKLFKKLLAGAVSAAILAASAIAVMAEDANIAVRNVMKTDDTTLTLYLSEDCDFDISGYSFYLREGDTTVAEDLAGEKLSERRIAVNAGTTIEASKDYTLEWYRNKEELEGTSFDFKTYGSFSNDASTVSCIKIGWGADAQGQYSLRPMKSDGSQLAGVKTTGKVDDGAIVSDNLNGLFGDKNCTLSYDFKIQDSRIAFGFLAICNGTRDRFTNNYIKDGSIYIHNKDTGLDLQETEDGWHSLKISLGAIKTVGIQAKVYIDDVYVGAISLSEKNPASIRMYATTDGVAASEFNDGTANYGEKTWVLIRDFKFEGTNSPYYSSEYKVEADRWSHGGVKGPYRVYSGPEELKGYIIAASYDAEGTMINANFQKVDMGEMDMIEYNYRNTVGDLGDHMIVYIWDGLNTFKPIKDSTFIAAKQ